MLESVYITKSKVRGKLLGILFSNPEHKYYLSELARMAGASVGNVQRELDRFLKDEFILREKKANLVFYFLNQRHALFPEIRSLVLKTFGIEGELRGLIQKHKEISVALLYGSFARGEEKGESDIDLLIVSEDSLEKFNSAISKLESKFSREINPTAYSEKEFRKKLANKDSFLTNVLKNPHIILKGTLDESLKSIARRFEKEGQALPR